MSEGTVRAYALGTGAGKARKLEIEGRSTMSKDELIAALRQQAK